MTLKALRSHIVSNIRRELNKDIADIQVLYPDAELNELINTAMRKFMEDTELLWGDTTTSAANGVVDVSSLNVIKVKRLEVETYPADRMFKLSYGSTLPV